MGYDLIDIYTNFLHNYESKIFEELVTSLTKTFITTGDPYSQDESNPYIQQHKYLNYGIINNKYQVVMQPIVPRIDPYSKAISRYDTNYRGGYTGVFYQSPKYERYQIVFIKSFGNRNQQELYIYGLQLSTYVNESSIQVINPFNPDQLDVYFDTIAQLNEIKYYDTLNDSDPIFYEKFGSAIDGLLTNPISGEQDINLNDNNINTELYFKDNNNLSNGIKTSVDRPQNYVEHTNVIQTQNNVTLYYDKEFRTGREPVNSLYDYDFYVNINNIYNYVTKTDLENYRIFDIITINNEYTIIAGKQNKRGGYGYDHNYYQSDIDWSINNTKDEINAGNFELSNYNNKTLKLNSNETVDYVSVFGQQFVDLITLFCRFSEYNVFSKNDSGIKYFEDILANSEFAEIFDKLSTIGANNFISYLNESPLINEDIIVDTTCAEIYNDLDYAFYVANIDKYAILYLKPKTEPDNKFYLNYRYIIDSFFEKNGKYINQIYGHNVHLKYANRSYVTDNDILANQQQSDSTVTLNDSIKIINYKQLLNYPSIINFESFITYNEYFTVKASYPTEQLNISRFQYKVNCTNQIDKNLFYNKFNADYSRQQLYGAAVDIEQSDKLPTNNNLNTFISEVYNNKVKVKKFPTPISFAKNNFNLATTETINMVNNAFNVESFDNLIFDSTNMLNVTDQQDLILQYVTDTTSLSQYDKSLYIAYNENAYIYSMLELSAQNITQDYYKLNNLYLLYDNYTDKFDIIINGNYQSLQYHYNKIHTQQQQGRTFTYHVALNDNSNKFLMESFDGNLVISYNEFPSGLTLDTVTFFNAKTTISQITKVVLAIFVRDFGNNTNYQTSISLDSTDFVYVNDDIVIKISDVYDMTNKSISNIKVNTSHDIINIGTSYQESLRTRIGSNFSNYIIDHNITINFIKETNTGEDEFNYAFLDVQENEFSNLLPQVLYYKPITLSIFDINETLWNLYPDNKKVLIFNHYINNNPITQNISDMTGNFTVNDVQLVDSQNNNYNKLSNLYKNLPIFDEDNFNKYFKIYIKMELDSASNDLFDEFRYENVYDLSLTDPVKGTLIADGCISDLTTDINFDKVFKEYKIDLILAASHNVNNTIKVPIFVELQIESFSNYNDFTNNIIETSYDIIENTIMVELRNRGEFIEVDNDFFPKSLDIIEYYEIYPEYSQQTEKLYIKELEISLRTIDSTVIKISELFFDILYITEDSYIGIPVDYKLGLIDPEDINNNFKWSNDKYDILKYFNWLIRFKCPNCTASTFKLFFRNKPTYFGFNVQAITLGCYSHNIKVEQTMPYIFYKESADTVMIIDKKTVIEKEKVYLPLATRQNYQNSLDTATVNYFNSILNNSNTEDLTKYVDRPNKSKLSYILFNSSVNSKEIHYKYTHNQNTKIIHTEYKKFNLAPLEFKLISLEEDIIISDYTNSFISDMAIYDVYENSVNTPDNTTFLEKAYLSLPSMDEYLRAALNFIDKSAKYVDLNFEKDDSFIDIGNESAKYQQKDNLFTSSIIENNSTISNIVTNEGISDIDYRFTINTNFIVTVDSNKLAEINTFIAQFGDTIYIKIPLKKYDNSDFQYTGLPSNYKPDSTVDIEHNNLIENNFDLAYLIGKKTNLNQQTFNLTLIINVKNEQILNELIDDNIINTLTSLSIKYNISYLNPRLILSLFFRDYGEAGSNQVITNLINNYPADNITELMVSFQDTLQVANTRRTFVQTQKRVALSGTANIIGQIDISNLYQQISGFSNTGQFEVYNGSYNGKISNAPAYLIPPVGNENCPDAFLTEYERVISFVGDTKLNKFDKTLNSHILDTEETVKEQLFDDIYDVLYDINSMPRKVFGTPGFYKARLSINTNNGLPVKHYMSIKCDNNFDFVASAKIVDLHDSLNNSYYINYMGDYNVTLLHDVQYVLELGFSSLKFDTLNIVAGNKIFSYTNLPYQLQKKSETALLQQPLMIRTVDTLKNPIKIVSDTNYKQIFEIPIEIFKALNSYLIIDKVKIADNFLNLTDYCIFFGDNNEIHTLKSNESKLLNKEYYKYNKTSMKMVIKGFNIPNQTGDFYTSIIIYYIFNGKHYTKTIDIRYRIELPSVLDNEQLLVTVTRLDNIQNPTFKVTTDQGVSQGEYGSSVPPDASEILLTFFNGTAGCNTSYPDLKYIGNNKNNDN